jgi:cobalt-zinc-cadmium efflux system outer membrane protein
MKQSSSGALATALFFFKFMLPKTAAALMLFTALGQAVPNAGQAASPRPDTVTIDDAIREALEKNIGLLAERFNLSIADARIAQARLRPNPVFTAGLDYQDWLGTGFNAQNGAGPPEFTTRLDYLFERGAKRERRVEVAENAKAVTRLQLLNTTRQLVLDVQSAFVDVQAAKDSLAVAQETLQALNNIVEINTNRVKAGDLSQVELIRSRLASLQFRNSVRMAELKLRTAKTKLQNLMGRVVPSENFDVTGDLRRDPGLVSVDAIRTAAMQKRPDRLAIERDQARSQADIRLQLAQGKIDYTLSAQYHHQYDNSHGDALGIFFSAPLPVYNRNQGEIERARQESKQIEARLRALEAGINTEIDTAYQQYTTSRNMLESIERTMLNEAREVRQITEYSYRRGEASLLEFLDATRAFNETMQTYNDARADFARSLYLLDSVSGKAVNP